MTTSTFAFAPRALIATIPSDPHRHELLTTTFAHANYHLCSLEEIRDAKNQSADLGLVDLRGAEISSRKAKAVASLLRRSSPESTIVFLIDEQVTSDVRASLRRFGEVICAESDVEHVLIRCRQLIRLRNIAEETGERIKSLTAVNRLVDFPPIASSANPVKVLIAGAPGTAAIAAINEISEVADSSYCVFSAGQAMRALDHEEFDCMLFLPTLRDNPLQALMRALRRHPKHSALATIQIVQSLADLPKAAKRGASDFILESHIPHELGQKLTLAARRARLRSSMNHFLNACAGETVRDPLSGCFTPLFLTEHGARLGVRADQSGRALSVCLIQLADQNYDSPPTAKMLHQATRMINRITRAEDLVARIANNIFAVIAPATNPDDASKICARVDGVLSSTAFFVNKSTPPRAIKSHSIARTKKHGAAIEETIAVSMRELSTLTTPNPPLQQSPR